MNKLDDVDGLEIEDIATRMLGEADQALYMAKEKDRNREVVIED